MGLLPWEHATSGLCCEAAETWLRENERAVAKVYTVEWWAAFYESPGGETRHQRWELAMVCRDCGKRDCGYKSHPKDEQLVPAGQSRSGWPVD
jgi:hypothetical protein